MRRPPTCTPRTRPFSTRIRSTWAPVQMCTPLAEQFVRHHADQLVRAALEGEHAPVHEVGKDDAVGDGRFVQGGAVGIGDRLHQQSVDVGAAGKEAVEQFPGGQAAGRRRNSWRRPWRRNSSTTAGATPNRSWRIRMKSSLLKVVVRENCGLSKTMLFSCTMEIADGLAPVFLAGLDHAVGKAVQGDIEDMAAALEPGGQPAQAGYGVRAAAPNVPGPASRLAQVRPPRPEPITTTSYWGRIMSSGVVLHAIVLSHWRRCWLTTVTPLSMAPTMPR